MIYSNQLNIDTHVHIENESIEKESEHTTMSLKRLASLGGSEAPIAAHEEKQKTKSRD